MILIVDDEPHNRDMIAAFLEMEGFQTAQAEDGEAALELVGRLAPDVILLDVLMPGPDGFEICRRLKADPATVFTPVVILTALRGADERIKGAAAGADEFLSKPFDHIELITRVKSLVRVKRLNDELQAANRDLERRVAQRTAELQHALTELQALDRLKSEFIANVSHELRTPVLHVKGYVDLLASGALGALGDEQAEGLDIAQEAIRQLERVVKDVVNFGDVYDQRLSLKPVMIGEIFETVAQSLADAARRKAITVTRRLPANLPPVLADAEALTRILRHLLDNAIKFSPAESTVTLSAERRDVLVRVAVRDEGPGIPPGERENIFKLFYQGDGSSTRRAGGLGLGLTLAKKLLEGHEAALVLESEMGRGSTFYFELPIA